MFSLVYKRGYVVQIDRTGLEMCQDPWGTPSHCWHKSCSLLPAFAHQINRMSPFSMSCWAEHGVLKCHMAGIISIALYSEEAYSNSELIHTNYISCSKYRVVNPYLVLGGMEKHGIKLHFWGVLKTCSIQNSRWGGEPVPIPASRSRTALLLHTHTHWLYRLTHWYHIHSQWKKASTWLICN